MRLFTGVFPPEPVARDIHAAVVDAGGHLPTRWIPAANLHVTLAFLGDVSESSLDLVAQALRQAASRLPAFTIRVGSVGAFPGPRRARVAFLTVRAGAENLTRLSDSFQKALPAALRPKEKRPFHAHLTLARFREPLPPDTLRELGARLEPLEWRFDAHAARLVESVLGRDGARYETRVVAPLWTGVGA